MLVGALRALAARDAPLIVGAFFWKLLSLEGYHPVLDVCAGCGGDRRSSSSAFDLPRAVLCAVVLPPGLPHQPTTR